MKSMVNGRARLGPTDLPRHELKRRGTFFESIDGKRLGTAVLQYAQAAGDSRSTLSANAFYNRLLDRYALREISWLVDIASPKHSDMVRQ